MTIETKPLRPTFLEINLMRLAENYLAIQQKVAPARVMPVVKANAYGHGLIPVARRLISLGIEALAVAILEEGLALRQAGIEAPILVLGGIQPEQVYSYLQNDLILTVTSIENLDAIARTAFSVNKIARVHIKIDTGMGRLGVPYYEADTFLTRALNYTQIHLEGIYSHFANADAADLTHARLQLARFKHVLSFYDQHGLPRPLTHMASSGAILQLPESYFDLVRPGIMLYGTYPSQEVARTVMIQPALTWKTKPVLSKMLPPNHPVSYGLTWQSPHPVRILTLPVGYGDGYFRSLSNRSLVLLHGKKYPIVGRVCMDQILVNLETDSGNTADEIILLGEQEDQSITADDMAVWAGTIPYEIYTNLAARLPRIYVDRP